MGPWRRQLHRWDEFPVFHANEMKFCIQSHSLVKSGKSSELKSKQSAFQGAKLNTPTFDCFCVVGWVIPICVVSLQLLLLGQLHCGRFGLRNTLTTALCYWRKAGALSMPAAHVHLMYEVIIPLLSNSWHDLMLIFFFVHPSIMDPGQKI